MTQQILSFPANASTNRFADLRPGDLSADEKASLVELALTILARKHRRGSALTSPEATRSYLRLEIGERHHELFGCLFLDNRHRIIAKEELFYGTIDGASVHPRVVVARALELNAAAVVFFHNHPSGVAEPSQSDLRITTRLKDALALVDVRVLDHLVVSVEDSVSLAERGLI
ncbi:DNA repair protein (plasmid) [Thioflavicoccus mobilis 8321]|jgi:DNA repair protein RadC|uniref:DNA repair protein n=1 Tax=Thioflavicoccus mobilis 8321 TaxID=765912 RepID=L0H3Z3_9GAMM|nr:DNA repair protein RadC [Thioflavicoccus mobilis]AGA92395.1 DNA repair protein [Thioflavicoccus mobilis 8321]